MTRFSIAALHDASRTYFKPQVPITLYSNFNKASQSNRVTCVLGSFRKPSNLVRREATCEDNIHNPLPSHRRRAMLIQSMRASQTPRCVRMQDQNACHRLTPGIYQV
jgi:hypothetical protein